MRNNLITLLLIGLSIGLSTGLCQAQDCCDIDTKLIICYTSQDDHCFPVTPAVCDYTYDGDNMEGIRLKLNNAANFGPNGLSNCDVEAQRLGPVTTVQEINDLQCDIILVGSFYTNLQDITQTLLDPSLTTAIRDWSMECEENLTIVSQGESTAWGYEVVNENVNPNSAGTVSTPNIFDGPFGSLTNFNQGGAFQANFSVIPSTGAIILAEDAVGRSTVVLDNATNDILMADVGIICNGPGPVSISPNINNDNDILTCNIFALGCEIAGFSSFTEVDTVICENESITLPDGMVVDMAGQYQTNLLNANDCDSIIVTNLSFSIPDASLFTYVGCDQDGFSVEIGGEVFDQSNAIGSKIVQNQYGCDSLVNIELTYLDNTSSVFDTTICIEDQFQYLGVTFDQAIDTAITILNAQNCDSTIFITVSEFDFPTIEIDSVVEILNNESYTFNNSIPPGYDLNWTPESGLSCTQCPNPVLNNVENIPLYEIEILSDGGCLTSFPIRVEYVCTPYIPNAFNPESQAGNKEFGAMTPCELSDYSMEIFDRWGSLVFETEDQSEFWNGRLKNKLIMPGVYVYRCEYSNKGVVEEKYGQLTLVR